MSTVQGRLRIAVQKSGRLAERSLDLVRDAGLRVVKGNNDLLYRVENYPIDLLRVRDDDIPTFVADGVCDLGIVGENVLEEGRNGGPMAEVVMPLGFGRCTLKIAAPPALDYAGPASLQGLRVATSYPRVLRRWLEAEGVQADIVTMRGAVEVAPRLKLAQAICDLVSTGATLEANGLAARDTVLDSQAVLIRAPTAPEPALAELLDSIVERMAGVVASQGAKYVMLNAPRSALDEIAAILPGAGAPTVMPLSGRDDAVAVHAVCQEAVFWETLERLKAAGASAILVLPIEKMM
ncbi:ATP phosphoribosyltransferase [Brevundimonas viscosa]|uniref:ATP phosphoribosyltransferase n=1 Tax=Brevundimonas viscosa TaxID=871741 RepID=A0A1I6S9Z1_9CAUL|nr:ATP phosphoribosyltransferase [Brevundimonas viscosa]SFS73723.1 ATP phosphoribosyltransferase [Brevundimonas viscosa]